jgi:hypothetical protein
LHHSLFKSWYQISSSKENKLVGFEMVISDGIHQALIVDLDEIKEKR